jgi:hypothetical protein
VGSYNAVILACAKSGRKEYVNEAFRIAKQMLDSNRDAYGRSAYLPDRATLCALLEGAKRIGDLARARWILADLVKEKATEEEGANEEIMMHVFHTYTSYVPPFTRNLAMVVPGREQKESTAAESDIAASSDAATHAPPPAAHPPRFTRIPPQTSHEVMEEVQALFQRILEDTGKARGESTPDNLFAGEEKFQHVKFTTRLLNSYLSVHYQHSSLEASEALFWKVFDDVGVTPDARSYLEALERCSRSKRGRERPIGLQFAENVWSKWLAVENAGRACGRPVDARMVERAHVAFMRVLVLYVFASFTENAPSHSCLCSETGSCSVHWTSSERLRSDTLRRISTNGVPRKVSDPRRRYSSARAPSFGFRRPTRFPMTASLPSSCLTT